MEEASYFLIRHGRQEHNVFVLGHQDLLDFEFIIVLNVMVPHTRVSIKQCPIRTPSWLEGVVKSLIGFGLISGEGLGFLGVRPLKEKTGFS